MPMILRVIACLAAILSAVSGVVAQEVRVPSSPAEIKLSYSPVVKRVTPAVVNVYAARIIENRMPLLDDPIFRRFFGGGTPREQVQRSLGSGVIVDPIGLIVTNHHVIEGADQVKVSLADKREYEAEIVLNDARSDLAVLRIKDGRERFAAIELGDSDALEVGDTVLAIGNPFGVGQTVTHGIVSALARTQVGITDYQFFIQTDAAINPGNSGGALVDVAGRLVGINTAIFSRSGGSQGIGFAIPVNMVRGVIASAQGGRSVVRRPWLGAKLQAVTPDIAESLNLKRPAGALVSSITPKSPAARAGLHTGDLITAVDGQPVDDANAFDYRFATKSLGGQAQLGVVRGGRDVKVAVPLESAPESPRDEVLVKARSPLAGAKVANLSPALDEELRLDESTTGVAVTDVESGSLAQNFGLQKGDVVISINNTKVELDTGTAEGRDSAQPTVATHDPAWRAADHRRLRRMSSRPKRDGAGAGRAGGLFAAAGLDRDAPRPLADRLRPSSLDEVVGQDHLIGTDGALTRMLSSRTLGSLIFWGPPGTGKTTVARLLADATALHFEQISAVFSGVADLKKVFEAARARRETGSARCCSSTRCIASIAPSRIHSCPSWRTGPWCWSAPPRKTHPSNSMRRCCPARARWSSNRSTPRRWRSFWRAQRQSKAGRCRSTEKRARR